MALPGSFCSRGRGLARLPPRCSEFFCLRLLLTRSLESQPHDFKLSARKELASNCALRPNRVTFLYLIKGSVPRAPASTGGNKPRTIDRDRIHPWPKESPDASPVVSDVETRLKEAVSLTGAAIFGHMQSASWPK